MTRPLADYFQQEDAIRTLSQLESEEGLLALLTTKADLGGDGKVPTEQMNTILRTIIEDSTSYGRALLLLASAAANITALNTGRAYFKIVKASDQTGITDNTPTQVTFHSAATYDNGTHYDTTSHKWTPPAGPIIIGTRVFLSGVSAAGNFNWVAVYKNGGSHAKNYTQVVNNGSIQVVTFDVANGTDYYQVYANVDTTGGTWGVSAGADLTTFYGFSI